MKLLLVNSKNKIPEDYKPELAEVTGGYYLTKDAAAAMKKMICAALDDGIELRVFSAYRSIEYQQGLFDEDMRKYIMQGYSGTEAYDMTAKGVAVPGYSEHNAGVAADISTMNWKGDISERFDKTPEFAWLCENACKFGYILRYPKGKESITGIQYEPWHYRYVGLPHSIYISNQRITLEEYLRFSSCCCKK
ncbi:MAG: M15 family metallopeptidase [Oscillospiraceae bacterium]|nr:M15 family metallopeptidase [Oscillospiraceae bacterium]